MSLTTLEYDTVIQLASMCSSILSDLHPKLQGLQQIYDSEGGVSDTLTQEGLDEIPTLSGLTTQQVTDAAYVLTALILPAITQGYPSLATLAARNRGFSPVTIPVVPPASMMR
jgi:hypothetical protein